MDSIQILPPAKRYVLSHQSTLRYQVNVNILMVVYILVFNENFEGPLFKNKYMSLTGIHKTPKYPSFFVLFIYYFRTMCIQLS